MTTPTTVRGPAAAAKTTPRLSADERRLAIVSAAMAEFAQGGYAGTPTDAIARRAGVSQPYLFQLFGTKKELFLAVVREGFARTLRHFHEAAEDARGRNAGPDEILMAMGKSYAELIADRDLLLVQLHAYAACADPEIRAVVRSEFAEIVHAVALWSGADEQSLNDWFAYGMLCNIGTAMGFSVTDGLAAGIATTEGGDDAH
jgi:AcrR family transcriptional regulator